MSKLKKIVLCIMLIFLILALAGCKNGIERDMSIEFVKVKNFGQIWRGDVSIYYDPETMICYMLTNNSLYSLCLTPYYIIGEDGKPEIAVYGVNYK